MLVWDFRCHHRTMSCLFLMFHTVEHKDWTYCLLSLTLTKIDFISSFWIPVVESRMCSMLSLKLSASAVLYCLFWQNLLLYTRSPILLSSSKKLILLYFMLYPNVLHSDISSVLSCHPFSDFLLPYLSPSAFLRLLLLCISCVKVFRSSYLFLLEIYRLAWEGSYCC